MWIVYWSIATGLHENDRYWNFLLLDMKDVETNILIFESSNWFSHQCSTTINCGYLPCNVFQNCMNTLTDISAMTCLMIQYIIITLIWNILSRFWAVSTGWQYSCPSSSTLCTFDMIDNVALLIYWIVHHPNALAARYHAVGTPKETAIVI